jgi:hypothetical protein
MLRRPRGLKSPLAWQEVDTAAACSTEDTGHESCDALADSVSLANSFLVDSAPLDQHTHAPVDTTQVLLAIFVALEDIPSSSPMPPPAFEDAPYTACDSVDTPPSAPVDSDFERKAPASPALDITNTLLTAGDLESFDSSISPSTRAGSVRTVLLLWYGCCDDAAAHDWCACDSVKGSSLGGVDSLHSISVLQSLQILSSIYNFILHFPVCTGPIPDY